MRKESATLCVTGGKIVRHSCGLGSYGVTHNRKDSSVTHMVTQDQRSISETRAGHNYAPRSSPRVQLKTFILSRHIAAALQAPRAASSAPAHAPVLRWLLSCCCCFMCAVKVDSRYRRLIPLLSSNAEGASTASTL